METVPERQGAALTQLGGRVSKLALQIKQD
jgi:hypothetical protein